MKKTILPFVLMMLPFFVAALDYPIKTKTLNNGLKIIVCEKNTNTMAEIQVWYRVGSKDEWDGVRGMAHLFEHMMFRGSKKFKDNDKPFKVVDRLGGEINAYTTFDRTVYHEQVPASGIETVIEMEADRMANLILDQTILDTEREVVGEEYRLGVNNWYGKMESERYKKLYPNKHPYQVDVIGNLNEITSFTTKQCQDFYDKFYSPNNAFVVITGNVKADEVFDWCKKYFGDIKKQLPVNTKKQEPDIFKHRIETEELFVDFPVQIYSYIIASPAFGHKDYYAFNLLSELLFSNSNSLLQKRIVNANLAYQIKGSQYPARMYGNYTVYDIIMNAGVGNAKVKKEVQREINNLITEGIDEADLSNYLSNIESRLLFSNYSNDEINAALGFAEYYYFDYNKYNAMLEEYKKIKPEDLKRIASTYFNPENLKVINIKPTETE
ncbi:MAG: insulinase family protein [Bacteroidia bacterium]|nr:insulinase family protein [Bacteroidia bacterium]